ncbi:hypothetical protein [Fischerella sp. PCC 9605]|nr:hypothetical protein [Fischerella sp. PCC 9605]
MSQTQEKDKRSHLLVCCGVGIVPTRSPTYPQSTKTSQLETVLAFFVDP